MSEDQPIDWLHSSNAERQLLWRAIAALVISGATNWNELLKNALGRIPSEHYLENFRRGLNSRKDCVRLFDYLDRHFPDYGRRVLAMRPQTSKSAPWPHLEGGTGEAELRAEIASSANDENSIRLPIAHLSVGERFCLELTSPYDGCAVSFREMAQGWHLLGVPRELIVSVRQGRQWLGQSPDMRAPPAFESSDREEVFHLKALIGSRELLEEIVSRFGTTRPLPTRLLNSLPAMLKASASVWCVASTWVSVMPRFNADHSAR